MKTGESCNMCHETNQIVTPNLSSELKELRDCINLINNRYYTTPKKNPGRKFSKIRSSTSSSKITKMKQYDEDASFCSWLV